ncbi:nanos homolog 3 isoform X1 [Bos javanicus]|uniref:nanos homolog 3 isoform X1 n=1 Tax=Bos javanicus TaxID=9906 RepID=UPI002AA7FD85|nr:nanos homolog 3 isoform X1 [Bos javanicus]
MLCVLCFSSEDILLVAGCGACLYLACVCVAPGAPTCVVGFMNKVVWRVPRVLPFPRLGLCLEVPRTPFPVFVVRVPLCASAPRAPLRSACIWAPACARSRPRVPVSPARRPGAASWSPVGIPACILVRLAGGLGAHTAAAGPTARQELGGGRGRWRRGARARHRDRQAGGRVGGGGRGFEPAPEPRGPLPLPAAWGAPAQPRSRQNAISRAGASRLGGLFRAGFGQKRGKQGGGPKTRFQRCQEVFWNSSLFLLPLNFCLRRLAWAG